MSLAQEDIQYIKEHIPQWLAAQSLGSPPAVYEVELRERTIRVEEELKHQRELMKEGFKQMDKRFESMGKRFESIDKRFESMQHNNDKVAARHDRMQWLIFLTMVAYFFKEKLTPLLGVRK